MCIGLQASCRVREAITIEGAVPHSWNVSSNLKLWVCAPDAPMWQRLAVDEVAPPAAVNIFRQIPFRLVYS